MVRASILTKKTMALPSFFQQPKHRQFNVKPRYYDPEKERIEELKKRYDPSVSEEEKLEAAKARIRESFQRDPKKAKGTLSTKRLFIYLAVLALLLLWILS